MLNQDKLTIIALSEEITTLKERLATVEEERDRVLVAFRKLEHVQLTFIDDLNTKLAVLTAICQKTLGVIIPS